MTIEQRLAAIYRELDALGLSPLVMGGHAARYYGIHRMTLDYDFHVALDDNAWRGIDGVLRRSEMSY